MVCLLRQRRCSDDCVEGPGLAGSEMIEFLADTDAALTEALGLVLTGDGKPYGAKTRTTPSASPKRCKRSACTASTVCSRSCRWPAADDPAGDACPEVSCTRTCSS